MRLPILILTLAGVVVVGVGIYTFTIRQNQSSEVSPSPSPTTPLVNEEIAGSIIIPAATGTLTDTHSSSAFIQEAGTSGVITYLAYRGDAAVYTFTTPTSGVYQLWAKTSDDGLWPSGSRDATFVINPSTTSGGGAMIRYAHSSQDTKGWVWTSIGNTTLQSGENTISVNKNDDTGAAFSFQALRFTPIMTQP